MSKTLLASKDVPHYIRAIVKNLCPTVSESDKTVLAGHTFRLYGNHLVGYENQPLTDCEKLLDWCRKRYVDAHVVQTHFWIDDVVRPVGTFYGNKQHRAKAYRDSYCNYITVVITDPVAYRFEKGGFYRQ